MEECDLWHLVESAKREAGGDLDRQVARLVGALSGLPAEEIVSFHEVLGRLLALSYDRRLWAAAYLINGGCSDDCFEYFRGWLIAQGRLTFENALRDPETLSQVAEPGAECEEILYAARDAFLRKTREEMPVPKSISRRLTGDSWTEADLKRMLPRLYGAFCAD